MNLHHPAYCLHWQVKTFSKPTHQLTHYHATGNTPPTQSSSPSVSVSLCALHRHPHTLHRICQAPNPDCPHYNSAEGTKKHLLLHCPTQVHRNLQHMHWRKLWYSSGTPPPSRSPCFTYTWGLRRGVGATAGAGGRQLSCRTSTLRRLRAELLLLLPGEQTATFNSCYCIASKGIKLESLLNI